MAIHRLRRAVHIVLLLGLLLSLSFSPIAAQPSYADDGRYFPETGFRVRNAAFLDFFDRRGGLRTFGYPVSNECTLYGFRVQFFQRAIMQLRQDGSVATLNFLDAGLMPYVQINRSVFPAADPTLLAKVPAPGSPGYGAAILAYVKATAPDSWQSLPVNFYRTFSNTVTAKDVFPNGEGNPALLPGFDLELWGVPTSAPAFDPGNHNFVYQRFQRGIMHYDRTTGTTQGLLLADYLKAIIIGSGLPSDLDSQARNSPLYGQYDPTKQGWIARPSDLPNSDLTNAFESERATTSTRGGRPPLEADKAQFLAAAIPLAQASQRTYGVPSSFKLAQAILETGWGTSELAVKGKNYFGIKAHRGPGTAGIIWIDTPEYLNGKWITVRAAFRAYNTMAESFDDSGRYLRENERYRLCFETKDPKEFARRIQAAGYATDPAYADKLIRVMDSLNLYTYDLPSQ